MPSISDPQKISAAKISFQVQFSDEETHQAEAKAIERLGRNVNVPGFRPGKAPAEALREKIPEETVHEEAVRMLVPDLISRIAGEQKLLPIIPPSVQIEAFHPLKVTLVFILKPEVTLKGLEKIKIEKNAPKFDAKDIDRMIEYVLDQHKSVAEVERAAAEGDQVTMDFVGVDSEKKEIEGTRSQGYSVRIGSHSLIPGFEEELIGLQKGAEKSFTVTFPEKYHAEHLRGKPATFTVNVTKVETVSLPALTDEFAKTHLAAESAEDFKKRIEESMTMQEENVERQKREEKLLEAIVDAVKMDVPEELLEHEIRGLIEDLQEQMTRQGLSIEDWLKETDRTPETLDKELREQADRRLKLRFGIEKALEEKQIAVTDEEMLSLVGEAMSNAPEGEKTQMAADFAPGNRGYEELKWRKRVERFIDMMLA